jgi:hypothetical protein
MEQESFEFKVFDRFPEVPVDYGKLNPMNSSGSMIGWRRKKE